MEKTKRETEFEKIRRRCEGADRNLLDSFFAQLRERTAGIGRYRQVVEDIFCGCINHHLSRDMSIENCLSILDSTCLGGFYARRSGMWYPLDDAGDMKCQREGGRVEVVYSLGEKAVLPLLQFALFYGVKRYPLFSCKLKKGFFRHYLECEKRVIDVAEYTGRAVFAEGEFFKLAYNRDKLIFTYIDGVIDNYGAIEFLRCIASKHRQLSGKNEEDVMMHKRPAIYGENVNGFDNMGIVPKPWMKKRKKCISIEKDSVRGADNVKKSFTVSSRILKEHCEGLCISIDEYIIEKIMKGAMASTDRTKGEISVGFCVDMRSMFPTASIRNFTLEGSVRINKEKNCFGEEISREVKKQMSRERLMELAGNIAHLYKELKYIPMVLRRHTKPYRDFNRATDKSCFFGSWQNNCLEGEEFYITLKPSDREIGCFITVLDEISVVTVYNPGADPSFFEKIREGMNDDGVIVNEGIDRKRIEINT